MPQLQWFKEVAIGNYCKLSNSIKFYLAKYIIISERCLEKVRVLKELTQMREIIIISELIINTLYIVHEILFYSTQYFYNYFIDFIYLNCSTMDVIHMIVCA